MLLFPLPLGPRCAVRSWSIAIKHAMSLRFKEPWVLFNSLQHSCRRVGLRTGEIPASSQLHYLVYRRAPLGVPILHAHTTYDADSYSLPWTAALEIQQRLGASRYFSVHFIGWKPSNWNVLSAATIIVTRTEPSGWPQMLHIINRTISLSQDTERKTAVLDMASPFV